MGLSNEDGQFADCVNLECSALDAPDLTAVTNMSNMFCYASSFNGDLSAWNTSACTDMNGMFPSASSFNGDLSGWLINNRKSRGIGI